MLAIPLTNAVIQKIPVNLKHIFLIKLTYCSCCDVNPEKEKHSVPCILLVFNNHSPSSSKHMIIFYNNAVSYTVKVKWLHLTLHQHHVPDSTKNLVIDHSHAAEYCREVGSEQQGITCYEVVQLVQILVSFLCVKKSYC